LSLKNSNNSIEQELTDSIQKEYSKQYTFYSELYLFFLVMVIFILLLILAVILMAIYYSQLFIKNQEDRESQLISISLRKSISFCPDQTYCLDSDKRLKRDTVQMKEEKRRMRLKRERLRSIKTATNLFKKKGEVDDIKIARKYSKEEEANY